MNRIEHILFTLAEECAEVAQRASKCARFGMDEVQPGQELTNEDRLWAEFSDVLAMGEMLVAEREQGGASTEAIWRKKLKVEQFMAYSAQCGTLQ